MKVLHIADIHWRGLSRHAEYILTFKRLFKKARELEPDIIYVGGDIVHSKTQGISPELIDCLSWWFNAMADIAPTHIILGNHDGLILNKDRQDAITPIIRALKNPRLYLYKDSGTYPTGIPGFEWCVLSCFDEANFNKATPSDNNISIVLYHGAVRGSLTDTDWQIDGEINLGAFKSYDFGMLGDIHKTQFLNERRTIAYCGSTIQQNYGESNEKGFLLWDIRSVDDFDVDFYPVKNDYSFVTVDWRGSVELTVRACDDYPRLSKFRIRADNYITQTDARRLQKILAKTKNASEVVFKIDSTFESSAVQSDDSDTLNLRDVSTHKDLLREYYKSHNLSVDDWEKLDDLIDRYMSEIVQTQSDLRNVKWSINRLKFDNMFSYCENNFINFEGMPGITGIFGRNAKGKSSIIGTIAYALFNTSDRGSIKNIHIINARRNSCKASIDISINNVPYRIIRSTIKKQNKDGYWAPTSLKFFRLDNRGEEIEDLTDEQRRSTERIIRSMIGGPEEFLMTSLASQGHMNTFIREKASARKTILANFLDMTVFDKMNDLAKKESNDTRAAARHLAGNDWNKRIKSKNDDIDASKKRLNSCVFSIDRLKDEIEKLTIELHEMGDDTIYIDVAQVKNSEKSYKEAINNLDKKNRLLDNLKDEIFDVDQKIKKLDTFLLAFNIDAVKERRTAQLQIEKTLYEIRSQHNLEKKELTNINKSVDKLSEVPCGDKFPTCKFIRDSHKNKRKLAKQEEKVNALRSHLSDIQSAYRKLKKENYEDQIEKYNQIIQKKSELVSSISLNLVEINTLENDISNLKNKSREAKSKWEDLKNRYNKQDHNDSRTIISASIQKKKSELKNLDKTRISIINKLAKLKAEISIIYNQRREYAKINKNIRLYDLLIQATSKRGIPVQIIIAMLPQINSELSKILKGVVGFTVELEADLESNAMDIYINYGDSKRIIELGSGMEKMMASLAIRVALINVSSLPKTNMLMLDEGFGSLDETNLEACGKLLQSLKKWFKNIIIISHIDAIKDIVDNVIDITKKGVDSHVYQP